MKYADFDNGPFLKGPESKKFNVSHSGQLRFTSKKMEEPARIILGSDPGAAVLMQSDHGARVFSGMSEEERRARFNSLYLHGQEADIEGLSTINTLRLAMAIDFFDRLCYMDSCGFGASP